MQRIPVLTTTLDSRSTEQVPTYEDDSIYSNYKKYVMANYNTAEKERMRSNGIEMLTDMFTAGRVRSSSILCTVGISAATGTC